MPERGGPDPVAAWRRLLREQHGLVTWADLRRQGVTQSAAKAHVAAGRWQHVLPRVWATFSGPLTRPARLDAALLYAGPHAVLSHRTAAEEWRMQPVDDAAPVHVTAPYRSSPEQQEWVVVHRSRALQHTAVATDPPRTSRVDTLVDLALAQPDARAAMRLLLGMAGQHRVRVAELRRRVEERPPWRYRRAVAEALRFLAEGVGSALEALYALDVEQAHAIPAARRQSPVQVDGRRLWEDCDYSHLGVPLIVRLDGRSHAAAEVAFRDRRRDNAAELAGRPRLVYGWAEVRHDACGVAAEVLTVLRREGWTTRVTAPAAARGARCSRCS